MAEAENSSGDYWDAIVMDNPEALLKAYNKYFGKYIRTTDMYKTPKGIAFALNNGSEFHLRKDYNTGTFRSSLYLTFCVNYKSCKNLKDDTSPTTYPDGKEIFSFFETGKAPNQVGGKPFDTREKQIENCKTSHYACATLIQSDGWKIKDDYPVKL